MRFCAGNGVLFSAHSTTSSLRSQHTSVLPRCGLAGCDSPRPPGDSAACVCSCVRTCARLCAHTPLWTAPAADRGAAAPTRPWVTVHAGRGAPAPCSGKRWSRVCCPARTRPTAPHTCAPSPRPTPARKRNRTGTRTSGHARPHRHPPHTSARHTQAGIPTCFPCLRPAPHSPRPAKDPLGGFIPLPPAPTPRPARRPAGCRSSGAAPRSPPPPGGPRRDAAAAAAAARVFPQRAPRGDPG